MHTLKSNYFISMVIPWYLLRSFEIIGNILSPLRPFVFATISDHFETWEINWDYLWPFVTIWDHLWPFQTIWNQVGPFWTIKTTWDHLGTIGIIWDYLGQLGSIWDHMGPFWNIWVNFKKKFFPQYNTYCIKQCNKK